MPVKRKLNKKVTKVPRNVKINSKSSKRASQKKRGRSGRGRQRGGDDGCVKQKLTDHELEKAYNFISDKAYPLSSYYSPFTQETVKAFDKTIWVSRSSSISNDVLEILIHLKGDLQAEYRRIENIWNNKEITLSAMISRALHSLKPEGTTGKVTLIEKKKDLWKAFIVEKLRSFVNYNEDNYKAINNKLIEPLHFVKYMLTSSRIRCFFDLSK
jgi:hypothetical protein